MRSGGVLLGLAFGSALFVAQACVGEGPPSAATTDGAGGCGADEKRCDDRCVRKDDPQTGCGEPSCNPCVAATMVNAVASCSAGRCAFDCAAEFADCDGDPRTGCERKITTDITSCGACDHACGGANARSRSCNAGTCAFTCDDGFAHCGTDDAKGCETSLSERTSCGRCGRDCFVGACNRSRSCDHGSVTTAVKPLAIAVDKDWIYLTTDASPSRLVRIQRDGKCAGAAECPTPIAVAPQGEKLVDVAVGDGRAVVAADSGKLRSYAVSGGAERELGTIVGASRGHLAIHGDRIFWTNSGPDVVLSAKLDGSARRTHARGSGARGCGIAVDATHVYWADCGTRVHRAAIAAIMPCEAPSTCEVVTTATSPVLVALDAMSVYFTEPGQHRVSKVPKVGATRATILATEQEGATFVTTDGAHVYWGNVKPVPDPNKPTENSVRRTPVGSPCNGLACESIGNAGTYALAGVVVDDRAVYWASTLDASRGVFLWTK